MQEALLVWSIFSSLYPLEDQYLPIGVEFNGKSLPETAYREATEQEADKSVFQNFMTRSVDNYLRQKRE